jgi:hypothetical protein
VFDWHCGGRMRRRAKTCENTVHETLRSASCMNEREIARIVGHA